MLSLHAFHINLTVNCCGHTQSFQLANSDCLAIWYYGMGLLVGDIKLWQMCFSYNFTVTALLEYLTVLLEHLNLTY